MEGPIITVGEAARRLGITPSGVRRILARDPRPLTAERRGGVWLLVADERLADYRIGVQQQAAARARHARREA